MQININNQTDHPMKYLGAAIYSDYRDVKTNPSDIALRSTGNDGTLEKAGGTDGLFGLVVYSCPDPTLMLVIYLTMPATTGTLDRCYVDLNSPIERLPSKYPSN